MNTIYTMLCVLHNVPIPILKTQKWEKNMKAVWNAYFELQE